jgi:hypothetical protein
MIVMVIMKYYVTNVCCDNYLWEIKGPLFAFSCIALNTEVVGKVHYSLKVFNRLNYS